MLLLTRNGWICLEFFPQTDNYNQRRYEANRCQAKPYNTLCKRTIRFGNITHTMEGGIVEKFFRLINKTPAKQMH